MDKAQFIQMLKNLPASCAYDAVKNINPPVSVLLARNALVQMQGEGVVSWGEQGFSLTNKGEELLKNA